MAKIELYPNRYEYLDYMKGIGIILVVFGHLLRGLLGAGIVENTPVVQLVDNILYSFHMPLFFFISGLLLTKAIDKQPIFTFFNKKLRTAFFLYALWSFIQIAIGAVMASHTNQGTGLERFLIILWMPFAQFWFLYILILTTSVAYLLLRFSGKILLPLLALSAGMYLLSGQMDNIILRLFSENFIFVLLGCAISRHALEDMIFKKETLYALSLAVIGFYSAVLATDPAYSYMNKTVTSFLLAFFAVLFLYSLSQMIVKHMRYGGLISNFHQAFIFMGASSLVIYLSHIIFCSGARIILSKILKMNNPEAHIVMGLIFGLVAPLVMQYILQKNRYTAILIHGIASKKK